jgi:hypothetical protein
MTRLSETSGADPEALTRRHFAEADLMPERTEATWALQVRFPARTWP